MSPVILFSRDPGTSLTINSAYTIFVGIRPAIGGILEGELNDGGTGARFIAINFGVQMTHKTAKHNSVCGKENRQYSNTHN